MSRVVLAIDTSGDDVALALASQSGTLIAQRVVSARRLANTVLLTEINRLLTQSQVDASAIEALVVGCGPGSFTGVRIAVATAKGLARGWGIPLFGVSTTTAMLWGMWTAGKRGEFSFALDAMRREIYPVSALLSDEGVSRERPDYVAPREDAEVATDYIRFLPEGLIASFVRGDMTSSTGCIGDVLPIYTRLSDAEETARQREGRPTGASLMARGVMHPSGVDEEAARADRIFLRPLITRDVAELHQLETEVFDVAHHPWSSAQFTDEFSQDNRHWIGLFEANRLIGYIGITFAGDEAELLRLGVKPSKRRAGYARLLLDEMRAEVARRGVTRVLLDVRATNDAARALYESYGFCYVAVREKYMLFQNGAQDAWVMALEVAQPSEGSNVGSKNDAQPTILGIETSCDETACAVLDGFEVRSNVVASQVEWHARFGGVVPEIASRKHIEVIAGVVDEALDRAGIDLHALDAIAVTQRPGLVGALVVGLAFAKGLSYATGIPLYGINHLEGHMVANRLAQSDLEPPFVSLIVSGGNTSLVYCERWGSYRTLGETLDDATGEAFDKIAKVLGLGYPGGPILSQLAEQGDPTAIDFPRAMMHSGDYRFSLSGLKTAVITYLKTQEAQDRELNLPDIAASFQQAIVDVGVSKAVRAVEETGVRWFCIGGGVAANVALREALRDAMERRGIRVSVPPFALCGDNGAMIAAAAQHHRDEPPLGLDAEASARASF